VGAGLFIFCGTFRLVHLTANNPPDYGALCPLELGLSSSAEIQQKRSSLEHATPDKEQTYR